MRSSPKGKRSVCFFSVAWSLKPSVAKKRAPDHEEQDRQEGGRQHVDDGGPDEARRPADHGTTSPRATMASQVSVAPPGIACEPASLASAVGSTGTMT